MAAGIIAATIAGLASLIGAITTTAMQISAEEDAAQKRAEAAKKEAAIARTAQSIPKFQPMERAPLPKPGSVGMVAASPRMQDTGYVRLSGASRMTAAERIKQQLQARRV